jgi:hypothetical protein
MKAALVTSWWHQPARSLLLVPKPGCLTAPVASLPLTDELVVSDARQRSSDFLPKAHTLDAQDDARLLKFKRQEEAAEVSTFSLNKPRRLPTGDVVGQGSPGESSSRFRNVIVLTDEIICASIGLAAAQTVHRDLNHGGDQRSAGASGSATVNDSLPNIRVLADQRGDWPSRQGRS